MDPHPTTGVVRRRASRSILAGLVASAVLLGVPAAQARETEVEKDRNSCRGDSTSWNKLKVVAQDAGILEVTAVVYSDDSDIWEWRMRHNGEVSAKGSVKAKDADKSFKIVRDMGDFPGTDSIDFRAENTVSGEICTSAVEY